MEIINKKQIFFLLGAVVFLIFIFSTSSVSVSVPKEKIDKSYLQFEDKKIILELADDALERTRGLSGRESLPENTGMFFVFDAPGVHSFWMKDMNFPIDIIWFNENLEIIHIEKSVQPESFPNVFGPKQNSSYVLEVVAGFSEENNLQIGDKIEYIQ